MTANNRISAIPISSFPRRPATSAVEHSSLRWPLGTYDFNAVPEGMKLRPNVGFEPELWSLSLTPADHKVYWLIPAIGSCRTRTPRWYAPP